MNRIYKWMALLVFVLNGVQLKAQKIETVKKGGLTVIKGLPELTVGDEMPDIWINKIINYQGGKARISDFKDQLLLLDYWNRGCAGCIAMMPKMESLQKQFGEKIKILAVTHEPENEIKAFWKRNKYTKDLRVLPSVVEDSVLGGYFPHVGVPQEVWIYKGRVVGITYSDYVNEKNIQRILNGEKVNWPVKNDFYKFDPSKPIFSIDPNQLDTSSIFIKYAAICGYKPGVRSIGLTGGREIERNSQQKTIRAYTLNEPVYISYIMNWRSIIGTTNTGLVKPSGDMSAPFYPNEVDWQVTDKGKYTKPDTIEQLSYVVDHSICFESVNPDTGQTDQQVYQSMIRDMNRLLGLDVYWEKRKEKVLILVRTGSTDKLKTQKTISYDLNLGGTKEEHYTRKGNVYRWRDVSIPLSGIMNKEATNPYVFDETNYTGKVDMDLIIKDWTNIAEVRKAIAPYGLALKEEERLVDKFVFREINGGLIVDKVMQAEAKANRDAQKDMKPPTDAEVNNFLALNKKKPGVITLPSGLQYKIIKTGKGAKPSLADKVTVHFEGTLVNGKIFDGSYASGLPATFGVTDVIAGWTEALQLMHVGSKWKIFVPAELAYGTHTAQGTVPRNSVLIFEIELFQIAKN